MLVKIYYNDNIPDTAFPFLHNKFYTCEGFIIREDCCQYSRSNRKSNKETAFELEFLNGDKLTCKQGGIHINIAAIKWNIDVSGSITKIELYHHEKEILFDIENI